MPMCILIDPCGIVRPGNACGEIVIVSATASRIAAVPHVATRSHGISFSAAISAETNAIQTMLMIPSAKSDAISAQQQPAHHAPFLTPIAYEPRRPERHEPRSELSGLRHLPRHT